MMKKALKIIAWILLALVALAGITWFGFLKPEPPPISAEDRVAVTLMPLPAELKLGKGTFLLDAAPAESYVAYRFGQDVDLWLQTGDIDAWERMTGLPELWALNHEKLAPAMVDNDRLLEVRAHSVYLSELARAGLAALSDPSSLQGKEEELASLFARASESYGATNLPVAGHVKKLVESSVMN